MIAPSPAPKRERRRAWPIVVSTLAIGLTCAAVAVASFPRWGASMVRAKLEDSLSQRTGARVAVGALELDWTHAVLREVSVDSPDAMIALERVDVTFVGHPLWLGHWTVDEVVVARGSVSGEGGALEALLKRAARGSTNDDDGGGGLLGALKRRVHAKPAHVVFRGIGLDVVRRAEQPTLAAAGSSPAPMNVAIKSRLVAQADGSVDLPTMEVGLTLRAVQAAHGGRSVRAGRISAKTRVEGGMPSFPLDIAVEGVATQLDPRLAIAKVDGHVVLRDAQLSWVDVDLSGGFGDESGNATGELWAIKGGGRTDLTEGEVSMALDSLELGRAPELIAALPIKGSEKATAHGSMQLRLADAKVDFDGEFGVDGLRVEHHLLAPTALVELDAAMEVRGSLDIPARTLHLDELTVRRGEVSAVVQGTFVHHLAGDEDTTRRYALHLSVPKVPCQAALEAIPPELIPSLVGFELDGQFGAEVDVSVDFAALEDLKLEGIIDIWGCKALRVPERVSAARLTAPFTHVLRMRDGSQRVLDLSWGSGDYTALSDISPHMVSAVLTTEDGNFWRHAGYAPSQFAEALKRNLEAGGVRLGASTITMQMVKNLLLSHDRTLSRKLQELFLTWYVENYLGKRRIMELYLNVIEFAPGIYGITQASMHYFGKRPRDLTSLEAAWLALMLPNPVRRHLSYCKGAPTPSMEVKLRRIHGLMRSRGRIDELEYELYRDAPLVFDMSDVGDPKDCMAEIERLLAAEEKQVALTGLLGGRQHTAVVDSPLLPIDNTPPIWPAREPTEAGSPAPTLEELELGLEGSTPAMDLEWNRAQDRERAGGPGTGAIDSQAPASDGGAPGKRSRPASKDEPPALTQPVPILLPDHEGGEGPHDGQGQGSP